MVTPMAESEYPSILDTEKFLGKIGKTEEFILYHNLWKRYFAGILEFHLDNLFFQHIFNDKLSELIKNLFFLEFLVENCRKRNF